jgi:RimJ/RimL family protein N-acetyltransferase
MDYVRKIVEVVMKEKYIEFDNYLMRLIKVSDTDQYFKYGFEQSDDEANYYTGTIGSFTKEQIVSYVQGIVENKMRYDFIIFCESKIVGEVVLSNIERNTCHYRICIYKNENFSKGIGFKATKEVLKFAFEELGLESVELEVFPFNERGIALYKKMGFEMVDELVDEEAEEPYRNIYTMRLINEKFLY